MSRQKPSDKVKSLAQKAKELADQLALAKKEAKKEAETTEKLKSELMGKAALAECADNPQGAVAAKLRERLAAMLKRPADRALFDLPPLPKTDKLASPKAATPVAAAPSGSPAPAASPIEASKAPAAGFFPAKQ